MKKLILLSLIILLTSCNEQWKREFKTDMSSKFGLNRKCTIYSQTGQVLKEYKGKFDIVYNDMRMLFELDGKRIQISLNAATVICEELKGQDNKTN